jgi:putative pyruvate formate lyase activating enzyme
VLKFDENGLAKRGVLVRHLVMPGDVAGTEHILRFLAEQVAPDTYVNVMAQYHPAGMVSSERYPEINRRITAQEYWQAVHLAEQLGLRLDERLA